MKASINGPNRRKNRTGDDTVASNFHASSKKAGHGHGEDGVSTTAIKFTVRSLEDYLGKHSDMAKSIGDGCLFTVNKEKENSSGNQLLKMHWKQTQLSSDEVNSNDPLLIHFHDLPVFVLKAIPLYIEEDDKNVQGENQSTHQIENIIYLSQAQCHNNKVCEDAVYTVTCCSRPQQEEGSSNPESTISNYDKLSAVQIEVFLRYSIAEHGSNTGATSREFQANHIAKMIMNHTLFSILTVNECSTLRVDGMDLVCRVSRVCVVSDKDDAILGNSGGNGDCISSAEASLDEPYRGRVTVSTEFYVEASNPDAVKIHNPRHLPEGKLPEDVIHITTSDDEWFPVRRILLASCINLTKYVQAGRGKYKETVSIPKSERSPDAPSTGIHCKVDIDCCTFDRVLLFIMSQLFPNDYKFALELSETNSLSNAADVLGLLSLSDFCASQLSSFASRVRSDKYIRFSEVKKRNEGNELLIIVDGMVLDISRWIDEHPGGPSIIPTQALNIDCTCFFEMYHVSRQSFLYLKSFYIGELNPADLMQLKIKDIEASEGFLHSLRSYTSQWRVHVNERLGEQIHKSL